MPTRNPPGGPDRRTGGNRTGGRTGGGGGGAGGGKRDGGRKRKGGRRGGSVRNAATRDVGLVIRPQLRELRNQRRGAKRDYRDFNQQMKGLYGALSAEFQDIGNDLGGQFGDIQGDYSGGIADIMGGLAQTTAPDQAGFLNTLGTFALAGQNELSSDQSREAAYNASVRRQGGIEGMQVRRDASGDLRDILDDLRLARRDVMRDRGPLVLSRLDQLRQQQFDKRMALADLALRRRALDEAGAMGTGIDFSTYPLPGAGGGRGGGGRGGGGGGGTNPLNAYRRGNRGLGGSGTVFGLGRGTGFDPRQTRG